MSQFTNAMNVFDTVSGMFGQQQEPEVQNPLADVEKALMMDNLQNYRPPTQPGGGTMFGMPGANKIEVDEIQQAQEVPQQQSSGGGSSQAENAAKIAMMFMSDRRLKRNIQPIGIHKGNQWYSYDYIWGEPSIGVIADEVPHAAVMHPSGFMMVDYSKVI
jgi:hypothetical protein